MKAPKDVPVCSWFMEWKQNEQNWTKISNCSNRPKMTWNRFVLVLGVFLPSFSRLGCPGGELGVWYIVPEYLRFLYQFVDSLLDL